MGHPQGGHRRGRHPTPHPRGRTPLPPGPPRPLSVSVKITVLVVSWLFGTVITAPVLPKPQFMAYNCSHPLDISTMKVPLSCETVTNVNQFSEGQTVTASIFSLRPPNEKVAFSCERYVTRVFYQCGMFSHIGLEYPPETRRSHPVDVDMCERMAATSTFMDESGSLHQINSPGITYISLVSAGTLLYSKQSVSCEGETIKIHNKPIDKTIILVDIELRIFRLAAQVHKKSVFLIDPRLKLQKEEKQKGVTTPAGTTFFWSNIDTPSCPLSWVMNIKMTQSTDASGKVILFNREHKILLVKKRVTVKHPRCKKISKELFKTNLHRIVVAVDESNGEVDDMGLSEGGADTEAMLTHIRNLETYTSNIMREEMSRIRELLDCERSINNFSNGFTQVGNVGVTHILQGELTVRISCEKIQVTFDEERNKVCYKDFPVVAAGPRNSDRWFLEPGTRALKLRSTIVPCAGHMVAVVSSDGSYFVQSPTLRLIQEPEDFAPHSNISVEDQDIGIFTEEQLYQYRSMIFKENTAVEHLPGIISTVLDHPDILTSHPHYDNPKAGAGKILSWLQWWRSGDWKFWVACIVTAAAGFPIVCIMLGNCGSHLAGQYQAGGLSAQTMMGALSYTLARHVRAGRESALMTMYPPGAVKSSPEDPVTTAPETKPAERPFGG